MTQETHLNVQAVRRVYENEQPTNNSTPAGAIFLVCHSDASLNKDIILWDDILAAFKEDVIHVRYGAIILPFLKGSNFKNLDPLRIAKIPGATLDIVVKCQLGGKDLSVESLREAIPTRQENKNTSPIPVSLTSPIPASMTSPILIPMTSPIPTFNTTAAPVRPTSFGGLVEVATQISTHDDYDDYDDNGDDDDDSVFSPEAREVKIAQPHIAAINNSNTITVKEPMNSNSSISSSRDSQRRSSPSAENLAKTMKKASQGDKHAQNILGDIYKNGRGVTRSYRTAMDWYVKSAAQGYLSAQNNIGNLYYHGRGVTQDNARAMYWYLKAAREGHATAQNNAGNMYYGGRGVAKDFSQAMDWYLKAAKQGHATAQNNIGSMYQHGQGVRRNHSEAKDWYLKAAKYGHAAAQNNIGSLYQHGQGVPKDCPEAIEWYLKAARQGHLSAQHNIGKMYERGDGVSRDRAKAMKWYKKAADQGYDDSKKALESSQDDHTSTNQKSKNFPFCFFSGGVSIILYSSAYILTITSPTFLHLFSIPRQTLFSNLTQLSTHATHAYLQAFRRVYQLGHLTISTPGTDRIIYIVFHPDSTSGHDIVLWDDIVAVFRTTLYVQHDFLTFPFLRGSDLAILSPPRIAALPSDVLEVVVDSSLRSSPKATPFAYTTAEQHCPPDPRRSGDHKMTCVYKTVWNLIRNHMTIRKPGRRLVESAFIRPQYRRPNQQG
ncbi:hypothetical protein BGZ95_003112 [Linnemannia exigua]|uniref:HCP-like protein n=1 Tax=Linnemannia exigua TaxID=604196 RepID=A0AAD4H2L2_9FUNG|nr:hypothetical protein BGZ95_003112 [Linnemannia exigua]